MSHPTLDDVAQLEEELAEAREGLATAKQAAEEAAKKARQDPTDDEAVAGQVAAQARADAYLGRIADLEQQIVEDRHTALVGEAEARMLGIKKGHGSLLSEYDEDVRRFNGAVEALVSAVGRLNDRYAKLGLLGLEAEAMSARFGLPPIELPTVFPPALNDVARDALQRVQAVRLVGWDRPKSAKDRQRRVAGTKGGQLIEMAGPTKAERKAAEEAEAKQGAQDERERQFSASLPPAFSRSSRWGY